MILHLFWFAVAECLDRETAIPTGTGCRRGDLSIYKYPLVLVVTLVVSFQMLSDVAKCFLSHVHAGCTSVYI